MAKKKTAKYIRSLWKKNKKKKNTNTLLTFMFFFSDLASFDNLNLTTLKEEELEHTELSKQKHECYDCGKKFEKKSGIARHMRVHTGEKHFSCDICGAIFRDLSDLNRHRRIHSGTKPFKCGICEKQFTRMDHVKRHLKTH